MWYDEFSLEVGDSLSQAIDRGIAGSRFGIVVISKAFIGKPWANHELRGLVNRDIEEDFKILPIWHGVSKDEVRVFSPSLSDKLAIDTSKDDAQGATIKLLRIIRRDLYDAHPHAELERLASGEAVRELQEAVEELRSQLSEYRCPSCGAAIVGQEYIEFDERSSGVVETFECGYSRGGWQERPCPTDSRFPKIEDYELEVAPERPGSSEFVCYAKPKTEMARRVHLPVGIGRTEAEARDYVVEHYNYLTTPPSQEFRGRWIQRSGYRRSDGRP
ncbi:MAG: toll/interleukin-1 receptor domain-containing protein [Rhodospirillales bacterium]